MSRRVAIVCVLVMGLAGTGWYAWRRVNASGTIAFQFVPRQGGGSPLTLISIECTEDAATMTRWKVRNESQTAVVAFVPAVSVTGPRHRYRLQAPLVRADVRPQEITEVDVPLPRLWSGDPWAEFRGGAMFTLGIERIELSDRTTWQEASTGASRFSVTPELASRLRVRDEIGWFPSALLSHGVHTKFSNGLSTYPINGSLAAGSCVMTLCDSGVCEFNGCLLIPAPADEP